MNMKTKRGFTLIELMIVVAIIGILAAIAIPKFAQLVAKSNEANTKGNLGAMRSALSIYYGDMEGWYPSDELASLTNAAKYMTTIPLAKLPPTSFNIGHGDLSDVDGAIAPSDAGGWTYNNTVGNANWGQFLVNCSHSDTKGNKWTSY
ncbi:MAG: hypothetical protein A2992_02130 [Elusimicrobia bacterium RIFCSPLOWO2_01_FULL_59_12]|nr:MAG: hypothetical protein A2992_02130 [Elusimicrobia bacterium RIFCSPLOWO2_01_FULL_59_12]